MTDDPAGRPRLSARVAASWLAAAFLSALCGIGGGLFAVPLLHYVAGLPLRRAVGTSLVLVLVLSATGTLVELAHAQSALDAGRVALLIVGGTVGARLGFAASQRVRTQWLKRVFAVVLFLSALRILALDASPDGTRTGAAATTLGSGALVLLIGAGGGFVAPLLGVGGGLVVIPALFLSQPDVSYLEARAWSTALSVFVAAQSVFLHARAGNVEGRLALRLALLTVLGSGAGVLAVHRPGWADAARVAMAAILLVVSGRFALDVLRPGRNP